MIILFPSLLPLHLLPRPPSLFPLCPALLFPPSFPASSLASKLLYRHDQNSSLFREKKPICCTPRDFRPAHPSSLSALFPSPSSLLNKDAYESSYPPPLALPQSTWDSGSGLSDKVRNACKVAREDGFRYLWIDSCCIDSDKASSSELSESIDSMFTWYRDA